MKVFITGNEFPNLEGDTAILHGYRMAADPCYRGKVLIPSTTRTSAYGRVIEVDKFDIEMMDAYFCVGLDVYSRVEVEVQCEGANTTKCYAYVYNVELV